MRPPCRKCGQVHRYCTAHRKADGQPCGRKPRKGEDLCRQCGGNAPQVRKAAERRKQLAAAQQAVKTYGLPVDTNPVDALLDEVRWTAGHVLWLRERVQEIEHGSLVWGTTEVVDKGAGEFTGTDTTDAARPNVWLTLYQSERKHLVDVCKTAIAAGLAERQVRIAEQQGEQLVRVIQAILGDLQLTPEQQRLAVEVVPRQLRAAA